jgi:hypothetical protein
MPVTSSAFRVSPSCSLDPSKSSQENNSREVDLNRLTPLEALNLQAELKKEI